MSTSSNATPATAHADLALVALADGNTPDGPYVRLWLGDVPIYVNGGALLALIAANAPTLSAWVQGMASGPAGVVLRVGLPGMIRSVLDVVRHQADSGQIDLPRPEPPRRGDVLAYFVEYCAAVLVDTLARIEWQASYVETADGGCEITGLAPRTVTSGGAPCAGTDAAHAGDPYPAQRHTDEARAAAADTDRAGSTLGDSGAHEHGQNDVRAGAGERATPLPSVGGALHP